MYRGKELDTNIS